MATSDMGHVESSIQIDINHLTPEGRLGIDKVSGFIPPRIINKTIKRTRRLHKRIDSSLYCSVITDIDFLCVALPPLSSMAEAVSSAPVSFQSKIPIVVPLSARYSDIARPIPLAAPVTITARSLYKLIYRPHFASVFPLHPSVLLTTTPMPPRAGDWCQAHWPSHSEKTSRLCYPGRQGGPS